MRYFLVIILLYFSFANVQAQVENSVVFPETRKKARLYFSPFLPYPTIPWIMGIKKIGEPYDSIKYISEEYFELASDKKYDTVKGLTLTVDTLQEIDLSERFNKSERYKRYYNSPKKFVIFNEQGDFSVVNCDKDTGLVFKALPVIVSNLTSSDKLIYIKSYGINIYQEALDKNGKWRPIELPKNFMCSMGFHWRTLQPQEQLITSVFKYKGTYKTLLRVKLTEGNQVVYSKPFSGSINYSQFDTKKIHYVEMYPFEK